MRRPRLIDSLAAVRPGDWNRLLDNDYPFLRHEFLRTLETTGCVGGDSGWQPRHLILEDDSGRLCAAAPLYRKHHSFGEFVFDFAWAQASRRLGRSYYPKLLCAVPYSPVAGPRLLAEDAATRAELADRLLTLPESEGASSLHLLFARHADRDAAAQAGALLRRDCHYHWRNRGYGDFEDFLATLSSKRRKEIRRERRRVAEAGIRIAMHTPAEIDERRLETLYAFYARTYLIRGQMPYLTPAFFSEIGRRLPDQVRYFVAYRGDEAVAMAFMLRDHRTLYGRHWGCMTDYHSLHFETCYYAGIEYCIAHGLQRFDAGAQGEHKIRRGFEPMATYSAHRLLDPALHSAVADYLQRESAMIAGLHADQRAACAFPDAAEDAP